MRLLVGALLEKVRITNDLVLNASGTCSPYHSKNCLSEIGRGDSAGIPEACSNMFYTDTRDADTK
jgi:hypothetical protein